MEEQISRGFTRGGFIRLGGALGVSVAGASVLAACGGAQEAPEEGGAGGAEETPETQAGEDQAENGTEEAAEETEAPEAGEGDAIAAEADVAPGSAVEFTSDGEPAVLVHLQEGDFVAYSAVCTHQGCAVNYEQERSELFCPCHGSIFDPANGAQVVSGPAQVPLPEIPVELRDGRVFRA